jgi:hypothetical protein
MRYRFKLKNSNEVVDVEADSLEQAEDFFINDFVVVDGWEEC